MGKLRARWVRAASASDVRPSALGPSRTATRPPRTRTGDDAQIRAACVASVESEPDARAAAAAAAAQAATAQATASDVPRVATAVREQTSAAFFRGVLFATGAGSCTTLLVNLSSISDKHRSKSLKHVTESTLPYDAFI